MAVVNKTRKSISILFFFFFFLLNFTFYPPTERFMGYSDEPGVRPSVRP